MRLTAVSDAQYGGVTTGSNPDILGVARLPFRQPDSTLTPQEGQPILAANYVLRNPAKSLNLSRSEEATAISVFLIRVRRPSLSDPTKIRRTADPDSLKGLSHLVVLLTV